MAQLVAHHTGSVGVRGSNPLSSTRKRAFQCVFFRIARVAVNIAVNDLARRMHASGESAKTIAETLGISAATVYRTVAGD